MNVPRPASTRRCTPFEQHPGGALRRMRQWTRLLGIDSRRIEPLQFYDFVYGINLAQLKISRVSWIPEELGGHPRGNPQRGLHDVFSNAWKTFPLSRSAARSAGLEYTVAVLIGGTYVTEPLECCKSAS